MANQVLSKFSSRTAIVITLSNLPSSIVGVGFQSTLVDNTTTRYQTVHIFCKITVGTDPTANTNISVYFIKNDGTNASDNAGDSTLAWTRVNARLLGTIRVPAVTSDIAYYKEFIVRNPGIDWGIGIVHNTGSNLETETGTLHQIAFIGENPEVQ